MTISTPKSITFSLAIICTLSCAQAKLRARYCYPPNHDPSACSTAAPEAYRLDWMARVYPGIWEGWDDNSGFKSTIQGGDLTHATAVSAEYWLDELYEPKEMRLDAPLMEYWGVPSDLIDSSYTLSPDGYFVMVAGGLTVDTPGLHDFHIDANDGALLWIDLNRDGQIDPLCQSASSKAECLNGRLRGGDTPWAWSFDTSADTTIFLPDSGLYKIVVWYWDHSEIGHIAISWRRPGGAMKPSDERTFGCRSCCFACWYPRIQSIEIDGTTIPESAWGDIDIEECQPVTFTATTFVPVDSAIFVWDINGDSSQVIETRCPTITWRYAYEPSVLLIQPLVRLRLSYGLSTSSAHQDVVFLWLDEGDRGFCTQEPLADTCIAATGVRPGSPEKKVADRDEQLIRVGANSFTLSNDATGVTIHTLRGRHIFTGRVPDRAIPTRLPFGCYVVRAEQAGGGSRASRALLGAGGLRR